MKGSDQRDEWDDDLPGFGIRIQAGDKPEYVVEHWGRTVKLGKVRKLTLETAKPLAAEIIALIDELYIAETRASRAPTPPQDTPKVAKPLKTLQRLNADGRLPTKLLQYREVVERGIKYTRRHLSNLEQAGQFPKRVRIGERGVGWVAWEIEEFLAQAVRRRE